MKIKGVVLTIVITLLLLAALAHPSFAKTTPEGFTVLGKGNTCAYYIDNDGDGYGVGKRSSGDYSGVGVGDMPDADDNDPTVNTPASMLDKYGTLQNFLSTVKGYGTQRIFYIAPNGNDTTGAVNNIGSPYATFVTVKTLIQAGDAVVYREGAYLGPSTFIALGPFNATAGNPLVIMAYPGEKAIIDYATSIGMSGVSHIVIDGLVLENTATGYGYGVDGHWWTNVTLRNLEVRKHYTGINPTYTKDLLIENNVVYGMIGEHGLYLGTNEFGDPNINITVRGNLIYKSGVNGIQHNGQVTNLIIEDNIIHSNGGSAVSLIMGTSYSTIRNNLMFNNNSKPIIFFNYNSTSPDILPYDQTYNVIENNTIWVGKYIWQNNDYTGPSIHGAIVFNNAGDPADGIRYFDYNTIRNNIIVTYNGPAIWFYQQDYADTTTIENNIFYKLGAETTVLRYGSTNYDMGGFNAFSALFQNNTFADPLFAGVSINYNTIPQGFNFDLLSSSPAIDFGLTLDAPLTDLRGNQRTGNPDAGCYEYAAGGAPTILYGDVSGNGEISAADASLAAQYAVGLITLTPEQITKADVSGNGEVSAADASLIAQRAVGLIDKFPVEG